MRFLYDIFFALFAVFYLPYSVFKGKSRKGFFQKLGWLPTGLVSDKRPIWIHAVSVGEAILGVKLAFGIKDKFPLARIIMSTTTATGKAVAEKNGGCILNGIFYYPADISHVVSNVVGKISPRMYIMVETELWPNLLFEMEKRGVPVILVNGRISDVSYRNYRIIRPVVRRMLDSIEAFCMQSDEDAKRIVELGALPEKVHVTGNVKFAGEDGGEVPPGMSKRDIGFGADDKIMVAGSTHNPEEAVLAGIFKELRAQDDKFRFILAPRHIQRAGSVRLILERSGLKCRYYSEIVSGDRVSGGSFDVLLVDTVGHLKVLYSLADLVFIGGSLVKKGGQNPIEAARWGKPVIFGPHMSNFKEIARIFVSNKAAFQVSSPEELMETVKMLVKPGPEREAVSENAMRVIKENAGAMEKTIAIIARVFTNTRC